jgi:L-rhamnose-H+ transport protein
MAFSVLGMVIFNWLIASQVIPDLPGAIRATPTKDVLVLLLFGGLWGVGAVLFGLGMDKLGMALGYPIIMGLILSLGALIPLVLQAPGELFSKPGFVLLAGTVVTLAGIVLCSKAAGMKDAAQAKSGAASGLGAGLAIAIAAGALSCFPNVGMNYAGNLKTAAVKLGASEGMAGNAAWALLFTAGFVVNAVYCAARMLRRANAGSFGQETVRNTALIAAMAALWIGSFYLYGLGAVRLGKWGGIIGWPLFISVAILVGNLWGLWRGEWAGARAEARKRLNLGLAVLIVAVALFGWSSAIKS